MILKTFKDYLIDLDKSDINILNQKVVEKGVEGYLSLLLVYLDCSRIVNNMRMMQTIGYPYRVYISRYVYILDNILNKDSYNEYVNKLISLHSKNLEYEKEHDTIIYDKKGFNQFKSKVNKHPRRENVRKKTTSKSDNSASNSLKSKLAGCANIKFNIKLPNK